MSERDERIEPLIYEAGEALTHLEDHIHEVRELYDALRDGTAEDRGDGWVKIGYKSICVSRLIAGVTMAARLLLELEDPARLAREQHEAAVSLHLRNLGLGNN